MVPNPIIIKSDLFKEEITEYALKQAILNNIDYFLGQLGIGFTYVENEYKIKLGNRYNYIDLLLYDIKYNCYVVVELKVTGLKKEHTGQVMTYMNYIDKNIKTIKENKTVGIIICKRDNKYVIEFCSNDRIIAREYVLLWYNNYGDTMNFNDEINELENIIIDSDYIVLKGEVPILFSTPHTMIQHREDGTTKLNEPYTKAISLYLNKYCKTYSIIKINDTGIDSNRDNYDEYNVEMRRLIKDNNIKLVIDLHGANKDRNFDIEFGTLNNLSADFSTIKELEESFTENGITNIKHNDPFKGGAITQGIYSLGDVDVIQLEINGKYRDYNNIELLKKLIQSLENFIKQYNEYINRWEVVIE